MKASKTDVDIALSTYKILVDSDIYNTEKEISMLKGLERDTSTIDGLKRLYRNNLITLYLPLLYMRKSIGMDLLDAFEFIKKKYYELFKDNEQIDSSLIDDLEKELNKLNGMISELKYQSKTNDCFDKTGMDKTVDYYMEKSVSISKEMVSIYELPITDKECINYLDQIYAKIVVYKNIIRNYENEERIFEKKINDLCSDEDIKSLVVSINNSFSTDANILNDNLSNIIDFASNTN